MPGVGVDEVVADSLEAHDGADGEEGRHDVGHKPEGEGLRAAARTRRVRWHEDGTKEQER